MRIKILMLLIILPGCRGTRVQHTAGSEQPAHPVENIAMQTNRFSLELFSGLNASSSNIFLSPYSIYQAAAMVYAGARQNTYRQIGQVLGTAAEQDTFLYNLSRLTKTLITENTKDSVQLSLASSAWIQENYPVLKSFSQTQERYFGSDLKRVDFIQPVKRELARNEINKWAMEQTEGKIQDLIGNNMLNDLTRLVLVNAIYFKGLWRYPFDAKSSRKGDFYLRSGDTSRVTYMYNEDKYSYYEQSGFRVVELPYLNSSLSMLLLLPDRTGMMDSVKNELSSEVIDNIYNGLKLMNIRLKMPRFKITGELNAKTVLEKMGMTEAFTDKADFSGISGRDDLKIDRFFQKAYIRVNETGSEAAAATAVIMKLKSALNTETIDFRADRPFLFFIADRTTHTLLFIGQVEDPGSAD